MNSIKRLYMKTMVVGDLHHGRRHKVTYGDPTIWDYKSLSILSRLIKEHEPNKLILAGDVFDNSKPSALAYSELISVIANVPSVWIIAGNHDISKVEEAIAFNNLSALANVSLVKANTYDYANGIFYIGWQSTQTMYVDLMKRLLSESEDKIFITHCSRVDFGNENDNIFTDELLEIAKENNHLIISGHEHKASIGTNFIHLGSVVPHAISEVGKRYYWLDGELHEIEDDGDIILTREEPVAIDPNKCYYVKSGKEVTVDDIRLESRDLSIDIIEDFWAKAQEAGFSKELIND